VWVNSSIGYNANPSSANRGALVLVHEIGHAIGLSHPSDYDASDEVEATYQSDASYYEDARQYTIMSYFASANTGANLGSFAAAPQMDDIAAAQRLYGANWATRAGDTTYGFNANADRPYYLATNASTALNFAVWDGGGYDRFDFSGYRDNQDVDLRQGAFSDVGGWVHNVGIAVGVVIEEAITGAGNDRIIANDAGDALLGGGGADRLVGGGGNDHLYGGARTAIDGDGADTLLAGLGSDYLQGNAGDDSLAGGGGSDRLLGGQGNDRIEGEAGNDSANGNLGDDTLLGGDGNDSLRGGQGNDGLIGGAGDDMVLGDLGDDTLSGGLGIDVMTGGQGNDAFSIGGGASAFAADGSSDMITDWQNGADRLAMGFAPTVLQGGVQASFAAAASWAQALISGNPGTGEVAAIQVGADTLLLWANDGVTVDSAVRMSGVAAGQFDAADFI
jgi:serralysin